jgi:hypothetical protein
VVVGDEPRLQDKGDGIQKITLAASRPLPPQIIFQGSPLSAAHICTGIRERLNLLLFIEFDPVNLGIPSASIHVQRNFDNEEK